MLLGGEAVQTDADGNWEFTGVTGSHAIAAEQARSLVTCPFSLPVSGDTSGLVFTAHRGAAGPGNMAGSGTASDPFVITNVDQLQAVDSDLTADYILCDDIDASAKNDFSPIGRANFAQFPGTFDGFGYEIRELHLDYPTSDLVGLFSAVGERGMVRNVGLVDGSATGKNHVGAIAGFNYGLIENVYNTGNVAANVFAGGLVGYLDGG